MRLLVAEDDPKLLKSLVHIFELSHYAVDGVSSGTDAFDFASSGEYDGLSLAKSITEKHKGEISAYKKDKEHIGFKVVL